MRHSAMTESKLYRHHSYALFLYSVVVIKIPIIVNILIALQSLLPSRRVNNCAYTYR